jgi:hypothetical protein
VQSSKASLSRQAPPKHKNSNPVQDATANDDKLSVLDQVVSVSDLHKNLASRDA